ncbi:MAG: hypothetical protein WEG36_05335 [Gemmatimonadota bacterium]
MIEKSRLHLDLSSYDEGGELSDIPGIPVEDGENGSGVAVAEDELFRLAVAVLRLAAVAPGW